MVAAVIIFSFLYGFVGLFLYLPLYDSYNFEKHQCVAMAFVWPLTLSFFFFKYFFLLIRVVIVSIYKTLLDIPLLKSLKERIEESKKETLYSSPGRVIKSIKERSNPW